MLETGAIQNQQLTRLRRLLHQVVGSTLQHTKPQDITMTDIRALVLHRYKSPFDLEGLRDRLTDELNRTAPAHVNVTVVLAKDAIRKGGGGAFSFDEFPSMVVATNDDGIPHYQQFIIPVDRDGPVFIGRTTTEIVRSAWRNRPVLLVNVATLEAHRVGAIGLTSSGDRKKWALVTPQEPYANTERDQLSSLNDTMMGGGLE